MSEIKETKTQLGHIPFSLHDCLPNDVQLTLDAVVFTSQKRYDLKVNKFHYTTKRRIPRKLKKWMKKTIISRLYEAVKE